MKFYSSEPNTLREELTRYQFFLQLKQDVVEGRLPCPHQIVVQLAALALQCEYDTLFEWYLPSKSSCNLRRALLLHYPLSDEIPILS